MRAVSCSRRLPQILSRSHTPSHAQPRARRPRQTREQSTEALLFQLPASPFAPRPRLASRLYPHSHPIRESTRPRLGAKASPRPLSCDAAFHPAIANLLIIFEERAPSMPACAQGRGPPP
ncbi:hypothetical protein AB1Y20_006259 [Prymnesium parvum]|uniref:Uncharacterized protein n=1 Tax=Prymnesium parvum TaxID=97485 RepID=A0AB34J4B2_PRYPA